MVKNFARTLQITIAALLFTVAGAAVDLPIAKAQSTAAQTAANVKSAPTDALNAQDRIEVFEYVWKTINEKYYDPSFNGVDWNAVRERYRPRVDAVKSDEEFYTLLNQMTGELRDAHTRVRSPRQNQERKKQQATSAGVLIYEVEGTPVVYDVTPDSEAARAGIVPGMIVRTIDGQTIGEALARARQEIGASSTERAARLLSYGRLMSGEPNTQLKLGLTRLDGTAFDVTLTHRIISAMTQINARLLASGYAYIKFNHFLQPAGKEVKAGLKKFKDAPGLILDLRANGGGDSLEGQRIAGYFFNTEVSIARLVTRTGKPPKVLFGLVSFPKELKAGKKGDQVYANPVVVLVNEGTGSIAELVTSTLQEQGRAAIIGTQSCGCVLGVYNHRELHGGGELSISEISFVTAKGRKLEGDGVLPDKPVAITLADLQSKHDATLEEAEKYLNDVLKRSAKSDLLP